MYEIPAKYLERQVNPKTKLPYYTFDKESLESSIKKLYKGEKIEAYKKSIDRIREMITNPFFMTLLNTANENEKRKIIRDMIMVDANAVNSEISRLLKLNPAYIGTKHMKKLMELSDNYREMFELLKPNDSFAVKGNQEPKPNIYNDHNNKSNEINVDNDSKVSSNVKGNDKIIKGNDKIIKGNDKIIKGNVSIDDDSKLVVERNDDVLITKDCECTITYDIDLYNKKHQRYLYPRRD